MFTFIELQIDRAAGLPVVIGKAPHQLHRSIGGLDNYHEQSHRCYSSDQKRKCGPVVLEPVFAHAQRSFLKDEQAAQIQ
jgi:hypothetical protein